MRIADADGLFATEVAGTTVGDRLQVNAWRDGVLLVADLPVTAWSLSWDAGRQVQGQATFTIADPDGELAPWGMSDALGPGGSRLQVTWVSGLSGTTIPLGWWRIRKADPRESWRLHYASGYGVGPIVRRNRHVNPRPDAGGTTAWLHANAGGTAGAAATVTNADGPEGRAGYRRVTLTAGGTGGTVGHFARGPDGSIPGGLAGDVVPTSMWVRYSRAVVVRLTVNTRSAGVVTGSSIVGTFVPVAANTWTRLELTATTTAAYDNVQVWATAQTATVWNTGDVLDAGSVIVGAVGDAQGPYFDGDHYATADHVYAWAGAAATSASTEATRSPQRVSRVVSGGGSVTVQADEETATILLDRLDAEVITAPTCLAEIRRLLEDIMAVSAIGGLVDNLVPKTLAYGDSRFDAVEDLLAVLYAVHRVGADGTLEVLPAGGLGPVWTIDGGEAGVLVTLARALSDADVFNAVVSSGQTTSGQPLIGRAYIDGGALAWGGPYGRVPLFHNAVATTQGGVNTDARTILTTRSAAGEVPLDVVCLTHPGIQVHDLVTLVASTTGGPEPIVGRVAAMSMRSAGSGAEGATPAKAMTLQVAVSAEALEAIAGRVASNV